MLCHCCVVVIITWSWCRSVVVVLLLLLRGCGVVITWLWCCCRMVTVSLLLLSMYGHGVMLCCRRIIATSHCVVIVALLSSLLSSHCHSCRMVNTGLLD